MILHSIVVGLALEASWADLDTLDQPRWRTVAYESVVFQVWGMLEVNTTGQGRHHVRWDTGEPRSWANYLQARAALARTPVRRDVL